MAIAVLVAGCSNVTALAEQHAQSPDLKSAQMVVSEAAPIARFSHFRYTGADPVYQGLEVSDHQYLNPILAGFYPDPGIEQVGGDYYIVNSTFAWFPGIPVFHSTDLVNWTQIGNVIDRPGMLDFDGLGLSRGVFAPTIEEHQGTFYVANTCVDCGGNFIVTADDPAGPWSDPVWIPEVGGIDPSLFIDEDGVFYLMNNDAPPGGSTYDGHRAIWLRAVDPHTLQPVEEPVVIIDGGVRPEERPIWIEGPHIYKKDGWYYLSAAEGGTAINHSQVILRSRDVKGPYEPWDGNPILTQRHLDPDREHPVTSVGHADYVQDNEGAWWATFLGVRPYEGDYYNTGRETFLMKVEWRDGWPVIADPEETVPYLADRPALTAGATPAIPLNGNFTVTETFDGDALDPYWMMVRVPKTSWWSLEGGALEIEAREDRLGDMRQPSFVARRQQHLYATAETSVEFVPQRAGDEAGLSAFQNDHYYYAIGVTINADGQRLVRLSMRGGEKDSADGVTLAEQRLETNGALRLRAEARGDTYDFSWATADGDWQELGKGLDARLLSTRQAGGFVGAVFGMYAQRSGIDAVATPLPRP